MALVVNDRVQQTGTANTTVSFTLSGSVVGYQSFAVIGNGNTTFYAATDVSGNWEVGIGTYATSGPTLTRTTILSSSNSGSAVTFSGTVNVFVTYPSEQSVNLNASGNVSALGTITSGVWNGSTIPVAYGGTGVTASSGANSVVLRDANQNIYANSVTQELDVVTSAGGTTVLTLGSSHFQILIGSTTQTFQLPDATTLPTGSSWIFDNDSTGNLFVVNAASGAVDTVAPGGYATVFLELNGTTAGTWGRFGMIPSEVNWGTNSLDMGGSTVITNGIWQGTPVASGYGGTGLTTFTATNNALYSTGATTLTAGTLPVAAGGTGATTLTTNGVVYGNGTSPAGITAAGTTGQVLVATTSGAPSWGSVPAGSITGTLPIANGGTGQTTAAAAFNALSPLTTTGDIIYEASASTAARLPVGSAGQVLTVAGGIPSWATPSTGAGTITRTDFTATSGQTVFTVSYTVGLIDVYQNGAKLAQADFTATNGTSITLATGATTGDLIQAEVFSSLNIYSTITAETFNGTGSQTIFTMSAVPANSASLLVAISGVVQDPTTYTVSSNTLTFSTAPPSGTGNVAVRYLGVQSVSTVSSFSAGTTGFTPATATTGGVVLAGTLNVANGGTGLTALGTAGQVLTVNSGATALQYSTPATTSPGGSTTQVQYNNAGTFGGDNGFVYTGGNVGIGTASPGAVLEAKGTNPQMLVRGNTGVEPRIRWYSDVTARGGISSSATYGLDINSETSMRLFTNGGAGTTTPVIIDTSGNVGLNNTSPAVLSSTTQVAIKANASADSMFVAQNSNGLTTAKFGFQFTGSVDNPVIGSYTNHPFLFLTNNTERMRITSAGDVGIGTASPDIYGFGGKILAVQGGASYTNMMLAGDVNSGIAFGSSTARVGQITVDSTNGFAIYAQGTGNTMSGLFDRSGVFKFNSGYGSVATAYGARAWVNFNGTGTVAIRASGNISSITDNGTGDYTLNFTNAMPDANYTLSGSAAYPTATSCHVIVWGTSSGASGTLPTASACRMSTVYVGGGIPQDCTYVTAMIVR